jgi:primosomal protein N' (replication factor Y)
VFAQVIVDIAHENVARVFTYLAPDGLNVCPGSRVRVPFGSRHIEGIVLALTQDSQVDPGKIKVVERTLEDYPVIPEPLIALAEEMARIAHCPLAQTLRLMLPAAMRAGRVKPKLETMVRLVLPYSQIDLPPRAVKQRALTALLSDGGAHSIAELKPFVNAPEATLRQLAARGLVSIYKEERFREPYAGAVADGYDYQLTSQQQEVLGEMLPHLRSGTGRYLLSGVTGSGKTEVYIRMVREVLACGKSAIILVPEIVLTPQMVAWFRERFPEVAAVMHSRLSDGERYDEWRKLRFGKARVAIGARSAVFAPVANLGLIVIDEEHELSYRSDHHPRYDARDVAAMRAEREQATLLLASATPSILSFARARRGDYTLLEMDRRVGDRPLARVHIVDMRAELENGNRSIFSGLLSRKLAECVSSGRQAILFLNRRGYASFVSCRACGHVMKCRQCDISMTYHKEIGDGRMHCHYCGEAEATPGVCPECGSGYIRYFGLGTQKVEDEARKLLPGVSVLRMDLDTTGGKDAHFKLLNRFKNKEAQILVGTQMIAKGLDFPQVTLVGAIAADIMLNLPDYRSRERTFQLLTQVAGRAGRGDAPGEVVIQTYRPEDDVILQAAGQDYNAFFETEFARRRAGLYPPFTLIARILIESVDEKAARSAAENLYQQCLDVFHTIPGAKKCVLFIRWDEAPVKLIRGKARYHVLMKLFDRAESASALAAVSDIAQTGAEACETVFELNPASMM